jgi:hypothetical protein
MRKLFAALFVAAFLFTGCTDGQYRKAVRATASVASGLNTLQKANESLFLAGEIDQDAARGIAIGVGDAANVNQAVVEQLKLLKDKKDLSAQDFQAIASLVNGLTKSVEDLHNQGVLHIKSEASKAKFDAALGAVKSAVSILEQLVGGVQ